MQSEIHWLEGARVSRQKHIQSSLMTCVVSAHLGARLGVERWHHVSLTKDAARWSADVSCSVARQSTNPVLGAGRARGLCHLSVVSPEGAGVGGSARGQNE